MLDKNSIEDKKVIRRIQSGETEDSQILIEKYYQEIFRFSYYMTGNKEDAYDCTQETFLKMIRYIGQYKEMQKFKAWLFQIARNVCYDGFRREKEIPSGISKEFVRGESLETPEKYMQAKQMSERVRDALSQLPDMQRDVLILRFYHELKIKEIKKKHRRKSQREKFYHGCICLRESGSRQNICQSGFGLRKESFLWQESY